MRAAHSPVVNGGNLDLTKGLGRGTGKINMFVITRFRYIEVPSLRI